MSLIWKALENHMKFLRRDMTQSIIILELERISEIIQVPHFTTKGPDRQEDLVKVHPELKSVLLT